ncbi:hypothetical protein ACFYNW_38405 [Streptomyces virginiae]|uniref:hypothetical protein n=1 Tax=Streptomyces virginiae TaxID=1961 RepID=UPI0036EC61DE
MVLVVDVDRAGRGDPAGADDVVEVDAAGAEADRGLVRAEGDVPVEEGRQVPAPGERVDLVGVDVGERDLAAEVDQQAGTNEVADRGGGHPRPAPQRLRQSLRQPVRRPPRTRYPQRSPHGLGVGGLHHRT